MKSFPGFTVRERTKRENIREREKVEDHDSKAGLHDSKFREHSVRFATEMFFS